VRKIAGTHPHMLAQTFALPHPGLARYHVDSAFVVFMQVWFGAAAWWNRDNV
jgi:hypothetical protein